MTTPTPSEKAAKRIAEALLYDKLISHSINFLDASSISVRVVRWTVTVEFWGEDLGLELRSITISDGVMTFSAEECEIIRLAAVQRARFLGQQFYEVFCDAR